MLSAILLIEDPEGVNYEQSRALSNILEIATKRCKESESLVRLGKYSFLFPLNSELPTMSNLVHLCDEFEFSYQVTYIDSEIIWDKFNHKD